METKNGCKNLDSTNQKQELIGFCIWPLIYYWQSLPLGLFALCIIYIYHFSVFIFVSVSLICVCVWFCKRANYWEQTNNNDKYSVAYWHHKRAKGKNWKSYALTAFSISKRKERARMESSEQSSLLDPMHNDSIPNRNVDLSPVNYQLTLPFWYKTVTTGLLIVIAVGSPSLLHIPYFIAMIIIVIGRETWFWKLSVFHYPCTNYFAFYLFSFLVSVHACFCVWF